MVEGHRRVGVSLLESFIDIRDALRFGEIPLSREGVQDLIRIAVHYQPFFPQSAIRSAASTQCPSVATHAIRTRPEPGLAPPTSRPK